jgi:hypothetical protein
MTILRGGNARLALAASTEAGGDTSHAERLLFGLPSAERSHLFAFGAEDITMVGIIFPSPSCLSGTM